MTSIDNLTIAIPVFERKEYFRSALVSILEQSVKCKLLVVDNASSHNFFKDTNQKLNINWGGKPYREREVMFPSWENREVVPGWQPKKSIEEGIRMMKLATED